MKRHLSFVAALGMCFFAPITAAHAQVRADTGSIAIGGSVTGSTVIIGIPQEKVDELVRDAKRPLEELTTQQRENIVLLKEKLDLNLGQVRAALGILGENDIPPERLAAKLVEIAERFKDLQATASAQPGDDPKIAVLKTDAQRMHCSRMWRRSRGALSTASPSTRPKRQPDVVRLRSPDCVMPRLLRTLPTRLACFPRTALTRTSESATSKKRRAPSSSKEPNLVTTAPCSRLLSDTSG